jgi:hypothetical protein
MTTYTVTIELDNDYFQPPHRAASVAAVLYKLADRLRQENNLPSTTLFDLNGNRCGTAELDG